MRNKLRRNQNQRVYKVQKAQDQCLSMTCLQMISFGVGNKHKPRDTMDHLLRSFELEDTSASEMTLVGMNVRFVLGHELSKDNIIVQ